MLNDFVSAFDNVDWDSLFYILYQFHFPYDLIRTIQLLYHNYHLTHNKLKNSVKINKGVI